MRRAPGSPHQKCQWAPLSSVASEQAVPSLDSSPATHHCEAMALVTRNIWKGTDMGSRLGVLIKQHDGWEMHYDHWAAQTIGADIALDGFEATMQRVRQMEPLGIDTPFEWNQGPLVEGALLIDQTNNTVVWVEESDGLYLPRIINALVERTWPGWTAVWSAEGKDGVLAAAGVDPDPLFTPFGYPGRTLENTPWFGPWDDFELPDAMSVLLDNGTLVSWRGDASIDDVADFGPDAIRSIALQALTRSRQGEPLLWDEQIRDENPESGVHVDYQTQTLRWWSLTTITRELKASFDSGPGGLSNPWVIITSSTNSFLAAKCDGGLMTLPKRVNSSGVSSQRACARTPYWRWQSACLRPAKRSRRMPLRFNSSPQEGPRREIS